MIERRKGSGRYAFQLFPAFLAIMLFAAPETQAQPAPFATFGAEDDPRERLQRVWWRRESRFDVSGGVSLIGPQWRAAASANLDLVTRPLTARLAGAVRGGPYGVYDADVDELYDLARLVRFARYNAPAASPFYLRAGLITRGRLGTGHLVNLYNSHAAWDERTVGAETSLHSRHVTISGFTDNVLLNGVTGGELTVRPFARSAAPRAQSLQLGFSAVTDLGLRDAPSADSLQNITAYSIDARFNALSGGTIALAPFASFADYLNYGQGFSAGLSLESFNFIDLARFRLRVAFYRNSRAFRPGYVGAFYQVNNPRTRIVDSNTFFTSSDRASLQGFPLSEVRRSSGLSTELRLLVFDWLELWHYFQRHYGPQDLSTYNLRLFVQPSENLRFDFAFDREGLASFFSLFDTLDDQTALIFRSNYRLLGNAWLYVRARYTFERLEDGPGDLRLFLPERRFESTAGLRFTF